MIRREYRFAGLEFAVSMPEDMVYENEYRLTAFRTEETKDPILLRVEKAAELTPPSGTCVESQSSFCIYREGEDQIRYIGTPNRSWEDAWQRAALRGKTIDVQLREDRFPGRIGTKPVLDAMMAEHLLLQKQGFVFHCSYIDRDGKAILFTAPSQTGKSTQAELWKKYRNAQIVNGDRAAVRIVDGAVMAEGIPFSGSSDYCENKSLPILAIVYLGQAPVTALRKLRGYEAFSRIWEGISVNTWDREDMEKAADAVMAVAKCVPVYHMACTPDESAVEVLEQELRKLVSE